MIFCAFFKGEELVKNHFLIRNFPQTYSAA
jgi:hypothetical protein